MHRSNIIFGFLLLLLVSCVEEYNINDLGLNNQNIVISGTITNTPGYHEIQVSKTADLDKPAFKGYSRCQVLLVDSTGNALEFTEIDSGIYRIWLDSLLLLDGKSYQLRVYTPEDKEYASNFETFVPGPEITVVYGERDDRDAEGDNEKDNGVQFYYNFNGTIEQARYYRYQIEETWEYHSRYPIYWEFSGGIHQSEIQTEYYYCYRTQQIEEVYTLSTAKFEQNQYNRFKLNRESQSSEKFNYKYSMLVTQYALSAEAYAFYNAVEQNTNTDGGMFTTQPLYIKGNISNVDDPDEKVLGFFALSTIQSKRFIFEENFGLEIYNQLECGLAEPDMLGTTPADEWPVYLIFMNGKYYVSSEECFDCRLRGGTTVKPEYW